MADALAGKVGPMCDCISYNAPEWPGAAPEVALPYPFPGRDTVCVDACIADVIAQLWEAGVETGACCCGHNGRSPIANGRPNVMIIRPEQAALAAEVLAGDPRHWWICMWAGGNG